MTHLNTEKFDVLFSTPYGSRLYGTDTPSSDSDFKAVFLPKFDDVLLGKKLQTLKERYDANGNSLGPNVIMPANGVETEYVPFQVFARDFLFGQTYALEMAWALHSKALGCSPRSQVEQALLTELVEQFSNADVHSMAGFAMKQTFDYVKRGERLNEASNVLSVLLGFVSKYGLSLRFDDTVNGEKVLDTVSRDTGLSVGAAVNNNKTLRTLELNGRQYLETSEVSYVAEQVKKLVKQYGSRSTAAAETEVDFKSLSHAVRVYEQAKELLQTGKMTFPRQNAELLKSVKSGKADLEDVKNMLVALDKEVLELVESSTQRKRTKELEEAFETWLLVSLKKLYEL